MADTVGSGVQAADTDYDYAQLVKASITRSIAAADAVQSAASAGLQAFQKLMTDAQANATVMLQGMGVIHSQWIGSFSQTQPAITANAIGQLNAASADSILNFIKVGAALANSASPPIPGYQNLGGVPSSQATPPTPASSGNVVLPKGSTVTVPAA